MSVPLSQPTPQICHFKQKAHWFKQESVMRGLDPRIHLAASLLRDNRMILSRQNHGPAGQVRG
jgi:hypothetical protein